MKKLLLIILSSVLIISLYGCSKDDDKTTTTDPNTDACAPTLSEEVRCKSLLPDCDGEKLKTSVTCLGLKVNSADRCSNKTLYPCGFCYLHLDQNVDGRCPQMTKNACEYCDDHKEQAAQ